MKKDVSYDIERLLKFSLEKNLIQREDVVFSRNALLDLLKLSKPYNFSQDEKIEDENLQTPSPILNSILDYCAENNLIEEGSNAYRDLMDARIMGCLMGRPSEVSKEFYRLYSTNKKQATDYFYELSKSSNYIQVDRIKKNLYWEVSTNFGDLEITVNLSKPEKDPNDIAKAKLLSHTNYPKCLLCLENEGFSGNLNHPARQNLRLIKLNLNNESWYMQYSPYVYYNEHCIVLCKDHVPMKMTPETFKRLLDFVDFLPHYFIGSNADIPIVGGSILSHDHFQGGCHAFPMEKATSYAKYSHHDFNDVNVSLVKWPMSTIRISSKDKEKLISLICFINNLWKDYSDEEVDIISHTENIPHNAITPIARINKDNLYEFDIVLRNNRTTDKFPLGIFHPHKELHHIKKENIGLIEVMGLAILPGRLERDFKLIEKILLGEEEINLEILGEYGDWTKKLLMKYGNKNSKEEVLNILKKETGLVFLNVLEDAGVFKYTNKGKEHFNKFMNSIGFHRI